MKRVAKVITVFVISISVIFCSSFFAFAFELLPLYSTDRYYNSYESSGTYPTVPSGFNPDVQSLNGRFWLSDYKNIDVNDWSVQGGVSKVKLGGFDNSSNMIIIRNDNNLYGVQFSRDTTLGYCASDKSIWFEWANDYHLPLSGISYVWSPDSFEEPDVSSFSDEAGFGILYKLTDDSEIIYCSLPIYSCTVLNNVPYFISGYRSADVMSACDMTFNIPFSVKYKTYTVSGILEFDSKYLTPNFHYVYEFDKLGLMFRDTPHVMEMTLVTRYYNSSGDIVNVDGGDVFYSDLDLYLNPYPTSNDKYRDYHAGEYYDYSFSNAFAYDSKFIDKDIKYMYFTFTICCDSPVLLFPGTLNIFSYDSYAENERHQELSNKISYIIDGDTGVPEVKLDTSDIDNTIQNQDEILQSIYDSLNDDILDYLPEGYDNYGDYLNDNINSLQSEELFLTFGFVKEMFDEVVSATGIMSLLLFSLTFGFAIYVLGRRLS